MCLAVTCHQHFGQNDQDLLHAAAVTQGRTDIKARVSTASWPQRGKFTHHTCRDSNLQPFNRESSALPLSYPCSTFFCTTSKFNLPNHKQSTEPQLWTQKRCNQVRNSNNKYISIVTFHLTTTTWSIISIPSMNPQIICIVWNQLRWENLWNHKHMSGLVLQYTISNVLEPNCILQALNMGTCIHLL